MSAEEWFADGHHIAYVVTQEQSTSVGGRPWTNPRLKIECPGPERCRMFNEGCGLEDWFSNIGPQDFMEEQARLGDGACFELPVAIEWAWEGHDDAACPVWRPMQSLTRIVRDTMPNTVEDANNPQAPTVLYREWAEVIRCGCKVVVGIRTDTMEVASVACPCKEPAHLKLLSEDYHKRIVASTEQPTDRPLVEVVNELLSETFAGASL